ncbi:intraflagellar transport particle protein 20 [Monoraphidium neglectum]|uniref:Intraflagellar transport particle protein 20 n=1 Tax=Monoraphidium neglectum TaxID=145388 RepID=A0A0D2MCV4_9CHLO|nr:intraflagellar transport particle protein 20 [Monoraphidium neglectum]KIZ01035.1 intraflagellar transport particle protein 20 [Monoraphidium neglectum]|eukprot:XP_013900054.1 intraflagellar transport particle protein 20 [Monoraphidium neglectum]
MTEATVYFDEDCKVRVLDVDSYKSSKSLQEECGVMVSSMEQLQATVDKYMAAVGQQVDRIEAEKLRAVGLRNRVAALHEERRRKRQELLQLLQEKQEGLDRLLVEEESLRRVRQEQDLMIAKLSDPSGAA